MRWSRPASSTCSVPASTSSPTSKDRKPVAAALKAISKALDDEAGAAALDAFEAGDWGRKHPAIVQSWRRAWPEAIPFFGFADDVRRIVYTTNAIEALNARLRCAAPSAPEATSPATTPRRSSCSWS